MTLRAPHVHCHVPTLGHKLLFRCIPSYTKVPSARGEHLKNQMSSVITSEVAQHRRSRGWRLELKSLKSNREHTGLEQKQ